MSLGIGVVGAGVMGADHVRTIANHVAHAHVAAVYDFDPERARLAAEGPGASVITDAHALIADPSVQAVVVASPDETHADYVLACIAAGKPVLCEKPLAPVTSDCLRVIEAEQAHGKRLVQVGYMRRFDPAYVEMKRQFDSGAFGAARLLHSVHRNATLPGFFRSLMSITNAAVHEFDISRWLLGAEFASVQVFKGPAVGGTHDPLMLLLQTDQGQLIDIEVFMKAAYGYEVRAELVCDGGTLSLAPPVLVETRHAGHQSFPYAADWRPRFATAYARQMQAWVDGIRAGVSAGASAWDGFVATLVAEAGVKAFDSGAAEAVTLPTRPGFYT